AAVLQSIAVTPVNPSILPGQTQPFTATGTFSDGSSNDVTSQVTWASATPAVATISTTGQASGVSPGTSVISATLNGVSGSTVLTVASTIIPTPTSTPLVTVSSVQVLTNKKHR